MGNRVVVKVDSKVSVCFQEFVNLLLKCGMPKNDLALIHCNGSNMEHLLTNSRLRMTQFTGSSHVADKLSVLLKGRIKVEDAGFDWKITGPDVLDIDHVASICDQDCFALSGQKCSAQSLLFLHENWSKLDFLEKFKNITTKRSVKEGSISPVLSWSNQRLREQIDKILKVPGAKLIFGGKQVQGHESAKQYGLYEPTLISIPLSSYFNNEKDFHLITTEIFGPVSIVTEYKNSELDQVLTILERLENHLTAGVVSNDPRFKNAVLSHTVNGVTYSGIKARTTGAPQNHWFGPCGDPRGAGIGTIESIKYVWSSHREIINDIGHFTSQIPQS